MIEKTRGIVLHQIRYTDSGIVAWIYTRKFGRQSFLIRGMRSRKTGRHNIQFQPLFIHDFEISYKQAREMNTLKEFSVAYAPYDIYSDVKKSTVAIFIGEVLTSVLREESPHEELFDYIEKSVIYFDMCRENYANFHIAFLSGLSSYLGFEPGRRESENCRYFDMINGTFVPVPPSHGNYVEAALADTLASVFESSFDAIREIPMKGPFRNEILDTILRYYSLHLPGLRKIRSLEILKEVFGS